MGALYAAFLVVAGFVLWVVVGVARLNIGAMIMNIETIENDMSCLSEYRDLLSVADLAEIFGVSKSTIYTEIKNGKFGSPITIGRAIKIPRLFIMKKFIFDYQ